MVAGRRGEASAPAELKCGNYEGLTEVGASVNIHLRPETEMEGLLYLTWEESISVFN